MSTGKRLAKRSIIGTRVCAPGQDGKYYSGAICARTLYSVRFDITGGSPPSPKEYTDRDLIGPGFGSVTGARLVPGQKVYLTFNGREIHAEVTEHRQHLDEVDVVIAPNGQEFLSDKKKRTRLSTAGSSCISLRQRGWWNSAELCGTLRRGSALISRKVVSASCGRSTDRPACQPAGRPAGRPVLSRDALRKYPTSGHAFEIMAAFNGVTGHRHSTARHSTAHSELSAVRRA
ncbi:ZN395 protein, partial [Acromyrmex insinuator]